MKKFWDFTGICRKTFLNEIAEQKVPMKTNHAVEYRKRDGFTNLTRRQALNYVNSFFDPLGLATPFIMKTKS